MADGLARSASCAGPAGLQLTLFQELAEPK
jgi:hypothetical protein